MTTLFPLPEPQFTLSERDRAIWTARILKTRGNEKEFQVVLVKFMRWRGWHTTHNYTTRINGQWITSTSSPGIPDLMAVRGIRMVFLELKKNVKAKRDNDNENQKRWVNELRMVPGVEAWFASPEDAAALVEMLM